jgi:hypothetical protein
VDIGAREKRLNYLIFFPQNALIGKEFDYDKLSKTNICFISNLLNFQVISFKHLLISSTKICGYLYRNNIILIIEINMNIFFFISQHI